MATQLIAVPIHADQSSWPPHEIVGLAEKFGLKSRAEADVASALTSLAAEDGQRPLRILIAGSLYLSGEVLAANGTPPT